MFKISVQIAAMAARLVVCESCKCIYEFLNPRDSIVVVITIDNRTMLWRKKSLHVLETNEPKVPLSVVVFDIRPID